MADNELANNISGSKQADDTLRQHAEEMKALIALSQRISGSLSLDHIIKVAFEELHSIVVSDLVLLFLRKGEEFALQSMQSRSTDLRYPGSQIKHSGECLCGLAGSKGKPQFSNDINTDSRCTQEGCRKAGIRSFAALPLLKDEYILGILAIAALTPQNFSRPAAFLEAAAGILSIAIQKALLHQEAERYAAVLEEEVAERHRAEQAQLETETRQAAILRTMQLVLYCAVTPSPFSATWMTNNVKQLTGFPVGLFLTEPEFWSSRIHPDDSERVARAFELIRSKKVMDLEYRWKCADGSYRWFLDRIISIQKEIAGIVEYFGIWLDITERKRQEEALRRSEERFRALFEQAAIGVFFFFFFFCFLALEFVVQQNNNNYDYNT